MKTGTMRNVAILCVVTMSAAGGALAQSPDWNRLVDQGDALEHAGNYKEAAAAYEGALRIAEKFDPTDARLPLTLNKLGITCDELGRFSDSDRLYRRAIAWAKHVKGKNSPEYASLVNNLAAVYLQQGQTGTDCAGNQCHGPRAEERDGHGCSPHEHHHVTDCVLGAGWRARSARFIVSMLRSSPPSERQAKSAGGALADARSKASTEPSRDCAKPPTAPPGATKDGVAASSRSRTMPIRP